MTDKIKKEHSHIDADAKQKEYLEAEKAVTKGGIGHNIFIIILFFAFIAVFAVMFWITPDRDMSEDENRTLQSFPSVTWESISSGTFTSEFSDYMADQFPFRSFFVGAKAAFEAALLKGENNGVIIGKNGYLIKRFDDIDKEKLKSNLDCISAFKACAADNGINVFCAFAGRTCDVATTALPSLYGTECSDKAWETLDSICNDCGIEYIDLKTPLREKFESGEYVYYKTDHHWTTLGAFYAYNIIAKEASFPVYDRSDFNEIIASDEFFGTTWSSAGVKWVSPDSITLFRYEGDESIKRILPDSDGNYSMYDLSALETKDKYSVFIGGNTAEEFITDNTGRECILVIKDSFAHSVIPFITKEYDVVAIDLRYYSGSLIELCRKYNISKIILLYNMETLSEEAGFRMFKADLSK